MINLKSSATYLISPTFLTIQQARSIWILFPPLPSTNLLTRRDLREKFDLSETPGPDPFSPDIRLGIAVNVFEVVP